VRAGIFPTDWAGDIEQDGVFGGAVDCEYGSAGMSEKAAGYAGANPPYGLIWLCERLRPIAKRNFAS